MTPAMSAALKVGRQAVAVLAALPLGEVGYTEDEVAAQYAATDRLIAAFQRIDTELGGTQSDPLPTKTEGATQSWDQSDQ